MPQSTHDRLQEGSQRVASVAREEARFGVDFLRRRWRRLLLAFTGMLLPLWAFGELADEVREAEAFPFDAPILGFARDIARAGLDQWFLVFSKLGYEWGVVPFDLLLILALAMLRKLREGLFAGVALIGSALLNLAAKQLFARARPSLWESIAPESTWSFPSGHAMGSMTLAMVLVLLAWRTRWRWWVALPAAGFVAMVGLSRVYLGVHYPSDILAGWAVATGWAVGVYLLVFPHGKRPWRRG
ncbi:MAG: phosphatase PAP2 family protein [Lysobacteraceae bacterium]|nr:MAG: phosphatase PAP2 family protein [Xanthomonadaceae bacterium]